MENITAGINERYRIDDASSLYSLKLNYNTLLQELANSSFRNIISNPNFKYKRNNALFGWDVDPTLNYTINDSDTTFFFKRSDINNNVSQDITVKLKPNSIYTLLVYTKASTPVQFSVVSNQALLSPPVFELLSDSNDLRYDISQITNNSLEYQKTILRFKTINSASLAGPIKLFIKNSVASYDTAYPDPNQVFPCSIKSCCLYEGYLELKDIDSNSFFEDSVKFNTATSRWEICNNSTFDTLATIDDVNAKVQGLILRAPCLAATTGPIILDGTQVVDGVQLNIGSRVLVKDQADARQNGIYLVSDSVWPRSPDTDQPGDLTFGVFTFVEQGTVNHDNGFVCTSDDPITIGVDPITFVQFSGAGQIDAGDGLTKTGNRLNVATASTNRIIINEDSIDLARSGAYPGTYASVTVDEFGRIVVGHNPIPPDQLIDFTLADKAINTEDLIYATLLENQPYHNCYFNEFSDINSLVLGGEPVATFDATALTISGTGTIINGVPMPGSSVISYNIITPGTPAFNDFKVLVNSNSAASKITIYYSLDGGTTWEKIIRINENVNVPSGILSLMLKFLWNDAESIRSFGVLYDSYSALDQNISKKLIIDVDSTVGGTVSPDKTFVVNKGEVVSFDITPQTGYKFQLFEGISGKYSDSKFITDPFESSARITPIFQYDGVLPQYQITLPVVSNGAIYPALTQMVAQGGSVSLELVPDDGYIIGSVSGGGGVLAGNTYTITNVQSSITVSANFVAAPPNEILKIADFTADANSIYFVSANITITLPVTPVIDDVIQIVPVNVIGITILGNGQTIMGYPDLVMDIPNVSVELIYTNPTIGWRLQ